MAAPARPIRRAFRMQAAARGSAFLRLMEALRRVTTAQTTAVRGRCRSRRRLYGTGRHRRAGRRTVARVRVALPTEAVPGAGMPVAVAAVAEAGTAAAVAEATATNRVPASFSFFPWPASQ